MTHVKWADKVQDDDLFAAESYLHLIMPIGQFVTVNFDRHSLSTHPAKDILRASGLDLLPRDNAHVAPDIEKILRGEKLNPVLLVRGRVGHHPLIIADGYHRVCAAYWCDENADIVGCFGGGV